MQPGLGPGDVSDGDSHSVSDSGLGSDLGSDSNNGDEQLFFEAVDAIEPRPTRKPTSVGVGLPAHQISSSHDLMELLADRRYALIVDGYNVSHAAWAGMPLHQQRVNLVTALERISSQVRAVVGVVFDGAVGGGSQLSQRSRVKVMFSRDFPDADSMILHEASLMDPSFLVVVTSDRALRSKLVSSGASVVGALVLLEALSVRRRSR